MLRCNYWAAIHDICTMSIKLAAAFLSMFKNYLNCQHTDFPLITPSTENLNRNFPYYTSSPLDCSQSPIFSWDRLDIPRLTATAFLILKCTEAAGVGDFWHSCKMAARRSRWSYGKIEGCEQSSSPSPSKIYDISVTGQWRHRKWARDLISFLTHDSLHFQKCSYM